MQHPTLDTFGVANLAPDFKFGGDLDRQARPLIDPQRLVLLARPFVQIHAVGFEADETRQRQFADRPHLRLLRARLSGIDQRRQNQHDGEGERQGRNLGGDP
jgi:hypothetical protein